MHHFAPQLGQCVGGMGLPPACAAPQDVRGIAQFRIEAPDAEAHEGRFHPLMMPVRLRPVARAFVTLAKNKVFSSQFGSATMP